MLRVFPRQTKATPTDRDVRFGPPGLFDIGSEIDEVHVSVTFTWDMNLAEALAIAWSPYAGTVKIGGPATGEPGGDFIPGRYLKRGYVITSRGCPNKCWFCSVWKREGAEVRELPISDGWNVLDDNLLACSDDHVKKVFEMLKRQKESVEFTGGLEAALLKSWHVEAMADLKPKQMFFAYDTPDDYEPLVVAGKLLREAGITFASRSMRCYVLIGFNGDDPGAAGKRMAETVEAGFVPMAMYYRNGTERPSIPKEWHDFQWQWSRPFAMNKMLKKQGLKFRG